MTSKFVNFFLSREAAAKALFNTVELHESNPGEPTILCMNRTVLASDLQALLSRTNLNFAFVGASAFKSLFKRDVPRSERIQTYYYKRFKDLNPEKKRVLKDIAANFLDLIREKIPYQAILSANIDYWQDEFLKEICAEQSIPFLVLCRENYAVGYEQSLLQDRMRDSKFVFEGAGVAVASDLTRKTMIATRALKRRQVHTVGWPRFDHWIDKTEIAGQSENLITLVCYHQDSYLAPRNFSEVLREFVDVAKNSGQPQNFCIKIKEIADKRALIVACPKLLFSGIEITARRSLSVIIEKSRVVIGYNTTGILEAYLSNACIVVPWWKDAVRPADECLITKLSDFDQKTTYFPGSPADLRSLIEKALKNELPQLGTSHDRIRQFQRFVKYDPKVSASSRFEKFVRSYLPDKSP